MTVRFLTVVKENKILKHEGQNKHGVGPEGKVPVWTLGCIQSVMKSYVKSQQNEAEIHRIVSREGFPGMTLEDS